MKSRPGVVGNVIPIRHESPDRVQVVEDAKPAKKAARAPKPPRPPRPRDLAKYQHPREARRRRTTAWVAGAAALVFIALAASSALLSKSVTPIPFGTGLLVEAAVLLLPDFWIVGLVHNLLLAALCIAAVIGCTVAHIDIPGNPLLPETRLWRRQEHFSGPSTSAFLVLLAAGLALHIEGHTIIGAVVQSLAAGFGVRAAVRRLIPLSRMYIAVELDPAHDGVFNRIIIGGGLRRWRRGSLVIFHEELISADKITASFLECVFGLATLRLTYIDQHGRRATIDVHALGSAQLVGFVEHFLKTTFKVARTRRAMTFPLVHPPRPSTPEPFLAGRPAMEAP